MATIEHEPTAAERAAKRAFAGADAICVEICVGRGADGGEHWVEAGSILVDTSGPKHGRASYHGGFLYNEHYNGPALSPTLDPRVKKFWPLERGTNTNVRSQNDMHSVFIQSLPDQWGTKVLEAHVPAYAGYDASERLATLSAMTECRVGALRFNHSGSSLDQSVVGLEALETMNSHVNRFLSGAAKTFLSQTQYWSVYSNGGMQPKVAFRFEKDDPTEWIAKFSLEPFGAYDQPRVERACMLATEQAKIVTPVNRMILMEESGTTVFVSKRYDVHEGVRVHRFNAAVALDREGKFEYAEYPEIAAAVRKLSTHPEADADQLFRRMLLNAYIGNTDDHLGQFEFVQQPSGGYRLAPAYDITIDDAVVRGPHQTRFAGGDAAAEYSVEWIEKQAEGMGVSKESGLAAARDVLAAVQTMPEYFERVGLSTRDERRVIPALRLEQATALHSAVVERLEHGQQESASMTGRRGMRR